MNLRKVTDLELSRDSSVGITTRLRAEQWGF
jgi:hypothetical protein